MKFTIVLATLSFWIYSAASATKHFVGIYKTVVDSGTPFAYPIDVCVNYEATFTDYLYGKYTCANYEVTFTKYGTDSMCTAANAVANPTVYATSTAAGELNSFQCTGKNNYVKIDSCTVSKAATKPTLNDAGGINCCVAQTAADTYGGCLAQIQATDVCINYGSITPGVYASTTCTNLTATTYAYGANGCAEAAKVPANSGGLITESDIDECYYYDTKVTVDIYRRMLKCVADGTDISAEDEYCPFVTTTTTAAATTKNVDAVMTYVVKNVFILVIGIAVYML